MPTVPRYFGLEPTSQPTGTSLVRWLRLPVELDCRQFRIIARIVTWQADKVLKAPSSALFNYKEGWCELAIEEGRARRRSIEVGHRNSLEAEVLKGLDAGQLVIRYPGNQVQEGMRVRVRP